MCQALLMFPSPRHARIYFGLFVVVVAVAVVTKASQLLELDRACLLPTVTESFPLWRRNGAPAVFIGEPEGKMTAVHQGPVTAIP